MRSSRSGRCRARLANAANAAESGFSIVDLIGCLVVFALSVSLVLPALGWIGGLSNLDVSLSNLSTLGQAHALYAGDWNDRQVTVIADELSQYRSTPEAVNDAYESANQAIHPPLDLGWGDDNEGCNAVWSYYLHQPSNIHVVQPLSFETGTGSFHVAMNARPFHEYVDGRVYSETYYAPGDTVPMKTASPFFDLPCEWYTDSSQHHLSSYCFSPAAMFHPDVMRAPSEGGFRDPWDVAYAFQSPSQSSVLFPELKTQIIEHHWVQTPPAECNPMVANGSYNGCEPYYFNHGIDSAPASLFYDGSTRLLPNIEVQAADQQVLVQTGGVDGLWSRDTTFGPSGYFQDLAFDEVVDVSHHVLTTGGIRGRDTLGIAALAVETTRHPKATPRRVASGSVRLPPSGTIEGVEP